MAGRPPDASLRDARDQAMSIVCPFCKAGVGEPCHNDKGKTMVKTVHNSRTKAEIIRRIKTWRN
jgi:hypothetical protein